MYPLIKEKYSRIALYGKDNYRHSEMINLKMLMACFISLVFRSYKT